MKKFKKACVVAFVWLINIIWSIWNRLFYLPRVKYASKEVKKFLKKEPCIIIANHTAHADGYLLPQVLPGKNLHTYITRRWYDKPKLKWIFSNLKYIPIDPTSLDTTWLARGEEVIKAGGSILIFPEGKLGKVGSLEAFHPGALMLARRCNVPVVPVALHGDYHAFCRKRIEVGEPITLELNTPGRPNIILQREMNKCRTALSDMLGIEEAKPEVIPAPAPSVVGAVNS